MIRGSWKLSRVFARSTASEHSMTNHIRQGLIKRTLLFTGSNCIDVEYRDGKLIDSLHMNYRIAGEGKHLFLYQNNQLIEFWEILSLGRDTMKLVSPANMVFSFARTGH
ncbi:MAG TPA: hypothetical protein VGC29_09670 [Flavisolibacter sp.]